jgi:hypothetical protein
MRRRRQKPLPTPADKAAAEEPNVPPIIVTGIRGSLSNALNTKRNSQVIVDSIPRRISALCRPYRSEALQRAWHHDPAYR